MQAVDHQFTNVSPVVYTADPVPSHSYEGARCPYHPREFTPSHGFYHDFRVKAITEEAPSARKAAAAPRCNRMVSADNMIVVPVNSSEKYLARLSRTSTDSST